MILAVSDVGRTMCDVCSLEWVILKAEFACGRSAWVSAVSAWINLTWYELHQLFIHTLTNTVILSCKNKNRLIVFKQLVVFVSSFVIPKVLCIHTIYNVHMTIWRLLLPLHVSSSAVRHCKPNEAVMQYVMASRQPTWWMYCSNQLPTIFVYVFCQPWHLPYHRRDCTTDLLVQPNVDSDSRYSQRLVGTWLTGRWALCRADI